MKVQLDCIPCFQRQTLQAVRFVTSDLTLQERVLRDVMETLLNQQWSATPPEIAHVIHHKIRELTGAKDPYSGAKQCANEQALTLYPALKQRVRASADPFKCALKLAIIGNVIDLGALASYDIEQTLETMMHKPLVIDDSKQLMKKLAQNQRSSLLYFADNAGEVVFDRLFLETLAEMDTINLDRITFVIKGGPIINDATIEDVKAVGLDSLPQLSIRSVSTGEEGTGPERNSPEVAEWFAEHDLTISKGQGNYEAMNEFPAIYFLLMVKCPIVARDLKAETGELVCWRS